MTGFDYIMASKGDRKKAGLKVLQEEKERFRLECEQKDLHCLDIGKKVNKRWSKRYEK